MSNESAHQKLAEAKFRSDVMQETTDLLNLFAQYMKSEDDSPMETDLQDEMSRMVEALADAGKEGMIGEVIFSLLAIVIAACEPEKIQEFLDDQSDQIQQMVQEAGDEHDPH